MQKNVTVIIDGQAGSCGKGKVIGQYAILNNVDLAITNCMPNAGHTFVQDGKVRVFRNIPVSAVNPNTQLFIGSGSAINMDILTQEYEENKDILEGREILVHPLVPIIENRHIEEEKRRIKSGSTFKGCGPCMAEKIMRDPNLKFFKQYKNIKADPDYNKKLFHYLHTAKNILLEGAQGCDLDLNNSNHYPYTTSRNVSVQHMLDDSGISAFYLKKVIMVIRPFPIRISNEIYDGSTIYSGPYGQSQELTWEQISVGAYTGCYATTIDEDDIIEYLSDAPDLTEYTTVTKKPRRIFDIDLEQLKNNIEINKPSEIYLNFFQHLNMQYKNKSGIYNNSSIEHYQREYLNYLEDELGVPITMLGTGKDLHHYIDRRPYVKRLIKKNPNIYWNTPNHIK